jgi:hypothetical protein
MLFSYSRQERVAETLKKKLLTSIEEREEQAV